MAPRSKPLPCRGIRISPYSVLAGGISPPSLAPFHVRKDPFPLHRHLWHRHGGRRRRDETTRLHRHRLRCRTSIRRCPISCAARASRIAEGYREENIPADADVVIIGNAISRGNPEAEAALDRKLLYHSLPEVMKEFFLRGKRNLVVSGTHGKTTTSSMLAWLLRHAGRDPGFMIGGLPKNLGCGALFTDSEFTVLEGDEYDTAFFDKRSKFLHYLPECVVINNIEFDHADIYNSLDEIKLTFRRLLNIVPRNGHGLRQRRRSELPRGRDRRALPGDHRRLRRKTARCGSET